LKLVDRYILFSALRIMVATIVIGVGVLTLARLIIILRLRALDDQDFGLILQMLGYFMPNYVGFMLPFALFWACFMVTRQLSGNSEIRAFNAAGISQKRLIVPLFVLGMLTVAINLVVYGWLEPMARYSYRALTHKIENTASYLAVQPGVFMKAGQRTIYVDAVDRSTRTFRGLLIYEQGADGINRQIIAERGQLLLAGEQPVLRLQNGNRMRYKPIDLASTAIEKPDENLLFTDLDIPLITEADQFHDRGNDEEELTLRELVTTRDTPPPRSSAARMDIQLQHKLVVILTALILPFFAVAMGQNGPRGTHLLRAPTAFVAVILYQQIVEFGKVFSREHGLSALAVLWPVFLAMAVISFSAFAALDASRDNPVVLRFTRFGQLLQYRAKAAWRRLAPRMASR
jgi:lipopolysaccharide export system permease protein